MEDKEPKEIGHQAERKIMGGEEIFIDEQNRRWIKDKLKEKGVILGFLDEGRIEIVDNEKPHMLYKEHCDYGYKGDDEISMWVAQTYFLAGMLQPEKFIDLVSKVAGEISDNGEQVREYLVEYFTNQFQNKSRIKYNSHRAYRNGKSGKANLTKAEESENEWKLKAVDNAIKIISDAYRWMEVINSGMEAEAIVRQGDYFVYRDLRERTIRGVEQKRKVSLRDIKRVWDIKVEGLKPFKEDRKIMSLPLGAQGLILENLVK